MSDANICRRVRISPYRRGMGPVFTLTLWDNAGYQERTGKCLLRYELKMGATTLASGSDFALGFGICTDSDRAVADIMGLLSSDAAVPEHEREALALEVERRFEKAAR